MERGEGREESVVDGLRVGRVLGRVVGRREGPTLVCVAGLHGNEPAGVLALRRLLPRLDRRVGEVRGEILALAGNRSALARGVRFIDADLNRLWREGRTPGGPKREEPGPEIAEATEFGELQEEIDAAMGRARGSVYVLDLHTTSSAGGAFTTVSDTLANLAFASSIPAPLVLGIQERVKGTLLGFLTDRGLVGAGFESGQHEDSRAVDCAEAAVWIALVASGVLDEGQVPEVQESRCLLALHSRGLPRVVEMRYRHGLRPGDGFRMRPGYRNFQAVGRGEVLASDRTGEIRSPEAAMLLMPLYQDQGEDGFFIVREVSRFWLSLSLLLRRWRLDRCVQFLPGVSRDPARPDVLLVDRRVARWLALQVFHLLGFRRLSEDGRGLAVARRHHDP